MLLLLLSNMIASGIITHARIVTKRLTMKVVENIGAKNVTHTTNLHHQGNWCYIIELQLILDFN